MALQVELETKEFNHIISFVHNFTAKKNSISILSNILLNAYDNQIEIKATDLDISIYMKMFCKVINPGCITLPGRKLNEIIRVIDSDCVQIHELSDSWAQITAGTSIYKMSGSSCEEYPSLVYSDNINYTNIDCKIFSKMIGKVLFSVASEKETIRSLSGVLVEKIFNDNKYNIRMVSSDGHRLTINTIIDEKFPLNIDKEKFIISKKGAQEIPRFCQDLNSISIGVKDEYLILNSENSQMIIKLLEADYPNYSIIFNDIDKENFFIIQKKTLLNSLIKILPFTDDNNYNLINIKIENDIMILTSQNIEYGVATDKIKINYNKNINVNYNCKYLIELLSIFNADNIKIFLNKDDDPLYIISDEDIGFECIVMPIKV